MPLNDAWVHEGRKVRQHCAQAPRRQPWWTAPTVHCPNCGRDAPYRTYTPGSFGLEVLAWVLCFPVSSDLARSP